jgi:hypothetical protein
MAPKLEDLPNIGPRSAAWLRAVGVKTLDDLFDLGPVAAYRLVKEAFPERVSLNLLYALQGALLDLPWNELPPEMKAQLRRQAREP